MPFLLAITEASAVDTARIGREVADVGEASDIAAPEHDGQAQDLTDVGDGEQGLKFGFERYVLFDRLLDPGDLPAER